MKEHAEHEEAGTLRTKKAEWKTTRPPVATPAYQPRCTSSQIGNPACGHYRKPKSRLAALCHKPALLRIKLDEAH